MTFPAQRLRCRIALCSNVCAPSIWKCPVCDSPSNRRRGCGVERALCKMLLDALAADKFLCVKSDGAYARLTEGVISRPRPVKAALGVEQRVATAS